MVQKQISEWRGLNLGFIDFIKNSKINILSDFLELLISLLRFHKTLSSGGLQENIESIE